MSHTGLNRRTDYPFCDYEYTTYHQNIYNLNEYNKFASSTNSYGNSLMALPMIEFVNEKRAATKKRKNQDDDQSTQAMDDISKNDGEVPKVILKNVPILEKNLIEEAIWDGVRFYRRRSITEDQYYENDFHDSTKVKNPEALPSINYINERKCPIYIHHLRADSSVCNNYGEKLTGPRTRGESPRVAPQIASKFVLDKLEETYWATWKPKKENLPVVKKKSPRKVRNLGFPDSKPSFQVHNQSSKKPSNKPHGDVNDNIIKYFKANDFESSSTVTSGPDKGRKKSGTVSSSGHTTTVSVVNENAENKKPNKKLTRPRKFGKVIAKDSVSQEIQTEVHCPVILEQISEDAEETNDFRVIFEHVNEAHSNAPCQEEGDKNTIKESEKQQEQDSKQEEKSKQEENRKPEEKNKKRPKASKMKKQKAKEIEEKPNLVEIDDTSDSIKAFIALKDSIEIAKEKQKSTSREQYQQPKCIRLYRKSGATSSYTKGGTYPLKSCLKKESFPKGNFRLGAPGSPLFITNSSFSNRRKK